MSLSKKVAFNTSTQLIGKVANTLLGLFSVALITRYLGVAGYGDYTTAFAYIMFFSVISDFGFFWVIVRKLSVGRETDAKIIQNAQSLRVLFALIVFVLAIILVSFLPYTLTLKTAIIMVAISIFWMGQNSVYLALFQAKLQMEWPVIAETVGRALGLGLVLLAIYYKLGFLWIVGAGLSPTFFNYIFNLIFSLKHVPLGFGFDKGFMKEIFWEAFPIGIVTILSLVYFKIDMILLSVMKTSADVGIYGTAYKILEILATLPIMFVGTVFPAISKAFDKQDRDRLQVLIQKSFNILSVGSFGVLAIFMAFARPVIELVAGDDFVEASTLSIFGNPVSSDIVLQVLIVAVGISFWSSLFANSLITFNKQRKLILPYVIATIFNVVANILFIPHYSYLAASVSTVITEIIIVISTYLMMKKYVDFKLKLDNWGKSALAGVISYVFAIFISGFSILIAGPIVALFYVALIYLFGVFTNDSIAKIFKKV